MKARFVRLGAVRAIPLDAGSGPAQRGWGVGFLAVVAWRGFGCGRAPGYPEEGLKPSPTTGVEVSGGFVGLCGSRAPLLGPRSESGKTLLPARGRQRPAGGADAALEFDEGVEGGEVDGAAGALGGWVFFDYFVGFGEVGGYQEVTDGGGDVGFGFAVVVSAEDFGGGRLVFGVVCVDVDGHWGMVERGCGFGDDIAMGLLGGGGWRKRRCRG